MDEDALMNVATATSEGLAKRLGVQRAHLLILVDVDTGASAYTSDLERHSAIEVLRELLAQLEGN